jgi:HEAT repeats
MATVGWMFFLAMMVFSIAASIGGLLWWEGQADRQEVAGEGGDDAQSVSRARELGSAAKTTNQRIHAVRIAKAERDVPYLMDALRDSDVRTYAARYLADLGVGEAGPAITRLLSASDARARSAAIKALARLQYEEVTATLIELASSDESPVVRSHAVGALGRTGSDERIERTLRCVIRSRPGPGLVRGSQARIDRWRDGDRAAARFGRTSTSAPTPCLPQGSQADPQALGECTQSLTDAGNRASVGRLEQRAGASGRRLRGGREASTATT